MSGKQRETRPFLTIQFQNPCWRKLTLNSSISGSLTTLQRLAIQRESAILLRPCTSYCVDFCHTRLANPVSPDFLDKKDSRFRGLQTVVDNTFKKLRAEGVGCNSEHTETLSKEEENSGILESWEHPVAPLQYLPQIEQARIGSNSFRAMLSSRSFSQR